VRKALCLASLVLFLGRAAAAGPLTQDACPGSVRGPVVWKTFVGDALENLLFADGSLWISDTGASAIRRFAPDGSEGNGLGGVASPGGLAIGSDGLIYAGVGNSLTNALLRTGQGKVVRFAPGDPAGTVEDYASGFNMPNGMTFGPLGDLFISNDLDFGLIRIPRAAPSSWAIFANVWGTNGLVIDPRGENLYAAITFDSRSPIERVPLADPASHQTAAQLTFGVVSLEPRVYTDPDTSRPLLGVKGLDDMTRDDDGNLYPVANGLGELLRVDPLTGAACLVASGFQNPSSARIAPAGSPFDTSGERFTFYVVEFSGNVRTVGFTPAR
jgi:hypothetical protein